MASEWVGAPNVALAAPMAWVKMRLTADDVPSRSVVLIA